MEASARNESRNEYGYARTSCACTNCATNCKFMPGYLIPSDLERMCPDTGTVFKWAETNLLASPGALVLKGHETFRIPTLVPAVKPNGSCINLTSNNLCAIHSVAPFGCAFFDCKEDRYELSHEGLKDVLRAWQSDGLYAQIWKHLHSNNLVQLSANILRERMGRYMESEGM